MYTEMREREREREEERERERNREIERERATLFIFLQIGFTKSSFHPQKIESIMHIFIWSEIYIL